MHKLFRSMMAVVAVVGVATMAACGGDSTGPGGGPDISGTWTLKTVDGEALPSQTTGITSMTAKFTSGGDYTLDTNFSDAAPDHETGTYTYDGTTLSLTATGETAATPLPTTLNSGKLTVNAGGTIFVFQK